MCETYIDEIEYAQTRAIGNQVVTIDCSLSGTTDRQTDGRTTTYRYLPTPTYVISCM